MIYEIDKKVKEIKIRDITGGHLTAGIITLDELKANNKYFGFSEATISECDEKNDGLRSSIDVYDDYSFCIINVINAGTNLEVRDKIGCYIMKNFFLLVEIEDEDKSVEKLLEYSVNHFSPDTMTLEKVIFGVFERLIYQDNKALEAIEIEIDQLENEFTDGKTDKDFNREIFSMKNRLLVLRNYYEQLIDVGEELQENENDIFSEDDLRYFKIFTDKSTRLSNNVQMLRENLIQLRDAYQAALDYNINRIMKVFTVVTTIFLPLTLIVGWYGMNFTTMPELGWRYGYIGVIALSVAVVIGCIIIFKKKKLL